jgi:hypothetical protein
MDYLTNHYKNICEQLQEQINFLQNQLDEARRASEEIVMTGAEVTSDMRGIPKIYGRGTKGKGAKRGREYVYTPSGNAIVDAMNALIYGNPKIGTKDAPVFSVPSQDLTPDIHDGSDADLRADSLEVAMGQQRRQLAAGQRRTL